MTTDALRLIFLTMLRGWLAAGLLLWPGTAAAGNTVNFDGSTVSGCTLNGSTYSCSTLPIDSNDTAAIASGYTVIVASDLSLSSNQGLTMNGSAQLQTSGTHSMDLSGSHDLNINGGTLTAGGNFNLGSNAQTITANVIAATVTTGGAGATINGSVAASGAINLGSKTVITGAISGASLSSGPNDSLGPISITGAVSLASNTTINGTLSAASVDTNSGVTVTGAITSAGTINLGSNFTAGGAMSGTTITVNPNSTLSGDITATTSLEIGSGGAVTGNITAPVVTLDPAHISVTGNIAAATSLEIGSGGTVNGAISGGTLTLRSANTTINGNATFTGNVDMASGTVINGDLVAYDVVQHASNAIINGNAAVNSIYIDWNDAVTKVITCTGPGAVGCSCVTKADPNYHPTCAAAPSGGLDHILITHGGQALTCQPQPVTLTACANASCTPPYYNGTVSVTLQPGGGTYTISSGTGTGYVSHSKAEAVQMTAAGAGGTTMCHNTAIADPSNATDSSTACNIQFQDHGLTVTVPDHVSMSSNVNVVIQALQASGSLPGCVPLVQNKSLPINFSCQYNDPVSTANASVNIGGTGVSCGSGGTAVNMNFDGNGTASASLQYPEVGKVNLTASYSSGGLSASGSKEFTAAPASFRITTTPGGSSNPVIKASTPYAIKIEAINKSGGVTTNFGKELSPESINFSYQLQAPATHDATTKTGFGAVSNGAFTSTGSWQFDDTGTYRLSAALANGSGNYMGNTTTGFNTQGTLDVLFIPDHFDTALNGSIPMACNLLGGYTPCKNNAAGKFVYSGQRFDLLVYAYIGKQDASGNYLAPQNYTGGHNIKLSAWDSAGGATAGNPGAGSGTLNWADINHAAGAATSITPQSYTFGYSSANKNVGQLDSTSSASLLPMFTYSSAATAASAPGPTTIYLRAIEALPAPWSTDGSTSQRTANSGETPLTVVSGRLEVTNNYGSLNSPLPVQVHAQYWNGSAYAFNPQFSLATAVALAASNVSYGNCQGGLAVGGTSACPAFTLASTGLTFAQGTGAFLLNAPSPKPSQKGSVDVQLVPAGLIPYLPDLVPGRETFGIYRAGPVIYTREVH